MAEKKPKLTIEEAPELEVTLEQEPLNEGAAQPQQEEAPKKKNPVSAATGAARSWLHEAVPGHEFALVGGVAGLIVALLVFAIGFWRTLFVVACVAVGIACGQYADGNPTMVKLVRRLFSDNRN